MLIQFNIKMTKKEVQNIKKIIASQGSNKFFFFPIACGKIKSREWNLPTKIYIKKGKKEKNFYIITHLVINIFRLWFLFYGSKELTSCENISIFYFKINVISCHKFNHDHTIDWKNINILDSEQFYYKRMVSETIHIKREDNCLNKVAQNTFLKYICQSSEKSPLSTHRTILSTNILLFFHPI